MDREKLIRECLPLCRQEALKWKHTPLETEELEADARVGLVRAAQRFDAARGVPFSAYALLVIRGAILDTVRKTAKRDALDEDQMFATVVSIDAPVQAEGHSSDELGYAVPDPGPLLEDIVVQRETVRMLFEIPKKEQYVLLRTAVDGATGQEVADELGVGTDRVYTLAHDGARRLRRRLAA